MDNEIINDNVITSPQPNSNPIECIIKFIKWVKEKKNNKRKGNTNVCIK